MPRQKNLGLHVLWVLSHSIYKSPLLILGVGTSRTAKEGSAEGKATHKGSREDSAHGAKPTGTTVEGRSSRTEEPGSSPSPSHEEVGTLKPAPQGRGAVSGGTGSRDTPQQDKRHTHQDVEEQASYQDSRQQQQRIQDTKPQHAQQANVQDSRQQDTQQVNVQDSRQQNIQQANVQDSRQQDMQQKRAEGTQLSQQDINVQDNRQEDIHQQKVKDFKEPTMEQQKHQDTSKGGSGSSRAPPGDEKPTDPPLFLPEEDEPEYGMVTITSHWALWACNTLFQISTWKEWTSCTALMLTAETSEFAFKVDSR